MLTHLACIMDGNRRWAQERQQIPLYGHQKGVEAIKEVIQFCITQQIKHLSLFAFAIQNFKRPQLETDFLFKMLEKQSDALLKEAHEKKIRMRFVGNKDLFPLNLQPICDNLEKKTAHYTNLFLNIFFCYGAQEEIVSAAQQLARNVQQGNLKVEEITPQAFGVQLWSADIPAPDLIIRTGKLQRLSNFLLFQAAYSEIYFLPCLWPDLTQAHLQEAVSYYNQCQRNFGV